MDSFEWHKLAVAAVISCSIFAGSWGISRIIIPDSNFIHPLYAQDQQENKINLDSANVKKGQAIAAQQCGLCHTFKPHEGDKIGPTLYNIKNRPIASLSNFNYSDSLKKHKKEQWTSENLNNWLQKPMEFAPATLMAYAGLSSDQDRTDVIAYLQTLSPTSNASSITKAIPTNPISKKSKDSLKQGKQAFLQNCSQCHATNPKESNRLGPNLYDIVNKPIASKTDYNYSEALKNKHDTWNDSNLDQWIKNSQAWAPNNKMIYQGIKSPEIRQAIITYLQSLSTKPGQK